MAVSGDNEFLRLIVEIIDDIDVSDHLILHIIGQSRGEVKATPYQKLYVKLS